MWSEVNKNVSFVSSARDFSKSGSIFSQLETENSEAVENHWLCSSRLATRLRFDLTWLGFKFN